MNRMIRQKIRESQCGYHARQTIDSESLSRMSIDPIRFVRANLASLLARSIEEKFRVDATRVADGYNYQSEIWAFTEPELERFVEELLEALGVPLDGRAA